MPAIHHLRKLSLAKKRRALDESNNLHEEIFHLLFLSLICHLFCSFLYALQFYSYFYKKMSALILKIYCISRPLCFLPLFTFFYFLLISLLFTPFHAFYCFSCSLLFPFSLFQFLLPFSTFFYHFSSCFFFPYCFFFFVGVAYAKVKTYLLNFLTTCKNIHRR